MSPAPPLPSQNVSNPAQVMQGKSVVVNNIRLPIMEQSVIILEGLFRYASEYSEVSTRCFGANRHERHAISEHLF